MCPSGNRAICCEASNSCECPENCPTEGNICNLYNIFVSRVYFFMKNALNNIFSNACLYVIAKGLQITGTCPETYDPAQNEMTTPNYPNPYPNNKRCNWTIEVAQGKTIELQFVDTFHLESSNGAFYCAYDWVQIYDGGSSSSRDLTGKMCGTRTPPNTRSSGNRLFLTWTSDSEVSWSGFKISAKLLGKY